MSNRIPPGPSKSDSILFCLIMAFFTALMIVPILAAPVMRTPVDAPAAQCGCILDEDQ